MNAVQIAITIGSFVLAFLGLNLFTLVYYGSQLVYRIGVQDTRLDGVCKTVDDLSPRVDSLERDFSGMRSELRAHQAAAANGS